MSAKRPLTPSPSPQAVAAKQKSFLAGLAETGTVSGACDAAGITRTTVYQWRDRYPDFKVAWAEVHARRVDRLEAVAYDRAVKGSDLLMMAMLNAELPDKYVHRRKVEISGGDQPLINIQLGEKQRTALSDALRELPSGADDPVSDQAGD